MLVPGDMAATWADRAMNAPAEAAREPGGETYTTTGTSALKMRLTIRRMATSRPPGVSISTTRQAALSASADPTARSKNSAVIGTMGPSMCIR